MKKAIKYLMAGLILLASSCNEMLDQEPIALRTAEGFLNDPKNAAEVVNVCYYQLLRLQEFNENNHCHDYFFGDLLSYDAQIGSTPNDFPDLQRLTEWASTNTSNPSAMLWNVGWEGVYNSNYILKNMPSATLDEALKSRYMGEAYFARGYWYLRFATLFGNVPIITEPLTTGNFTEVVQGTIHDAFEQAVSDFKEAAKLLPVKSAYGPSDLGRATKGAAMAFLTRTLMYQIGFDKDNTHTWQDVYNETSAIINSGQYTLTPNYATIYNPEGENNAESIFELQTIYNDYERNTQATGTHGPTCQGVRTNNKFGNVTIWGWGYNQPTQDLVNEFEPNDPRLSCTVYGLPYNNGIVNGVIFNYALSTEWTPYHNRKMAYPPEYADKAGWWKGSTNLRQIRYAEVLLNHAEAAYRLNKEGEAREYINKVRGRARTSTYARGYEAGKTYDYKPTGFVNNLPDITASGTALFNAIVHERRVELGMESLRYYDLVRWGMYFDELNKKRATAPRPYQTNPAVLAYENIDLRANALSHSIDGPEGRKIPLIPIPRDEVNTWGLKQNSGY